MLSTLPWLMLEESRNLHAQFFPSKHIRMLRFAKTYRGIYHRAAMVCEDNPDGHGDLPILPS